MKVNGVKKWVECIGFSAKTISVGLRNTLKYHFSQFANDFRVRLRFFADSEFSAKKLFHFFQTKSAHLSSLKGN